MTVVTNDIIRDGTRGVLLLGELAYSPLPLVGVSCVPLRTITCVTTRIRLIVI